MRRPPDGWITVEQAAERLYYSVNYFRVVFCDKNNPRLTIMRQPGRILVLSKDVDRLSDDRIERPA